MRITTKATYDMATMELLTWEGYEYSGPVSCCKHDEARNLALQQQQQQLRLQKQAFDYQKGLMDQVQGNLKQYLSGNVGFDPQQLALLQTQFLGSNAQDFNQARSGVIGALAARGAGGGQQPLGGDYTRGLSGLYGAEASSHAGGLANIGLQNLAQALTNKFNTANIFSGNAATLSSPISTFGSGANAGLSSFTQAALTPGFGQSILGSFAQGLGGGIGTGVTGGLGKLIGGLGCWLAAECYNGWDDVRTIIVRQSIDWTGFWGGMYLKHGATWAKVVRKLPVLKRLIRPIFDRILKRAYECS